MSRFDEQGLFWVDAKPENRARAKTARVKPPIPETNWQMPAEFPRLEAAEMLCIDIETCDTGLQNGKGPGEFREDSYICGIAVAVPEGQQWYFPMRHDLGPNFDPEVVSRWARDELCRKNQPKLGANLLYDLGFLYQANIPVTGPFFDVQFAEPLLDEHADSYSLQTLAEKYCNEGKEDDLLYDWLSMAYGGKATRGAQGGRIHLAPSQIVGPYAESDVRLPFLIHNEQLKALEAEGLLELYNLECRLIPLLLEMRRRGVRIDHNKADELHKTLKQKINDDHKKIKDLVGFEVNVNAAADIVKVFKSLSLEYPTTDKGNPSFTKPFLEAHPHPITDLITDIRKWEKFDSTFVKGYLFDHSINGRIHCSFHPLRTDKNGTVSGRFSSSNPNLQNIPSRDKVLAPLVRGLFVPDDGCYWEKKDYSQIEYRKFLHYAEGAEAEAAREEFRRDPKTDYHLLVSRWSKLDRKPAKNLNFGVIYGMGKETTAQGNGWSLEEATRFLSLYHEKVPFAKPLLEKASQIAESRGYVRTILNRRARFVYWEPARWPDKQKDGVKKWSAKKRKQAEKEWPGERLKRAFCYAALNRILQGGAADIMKKAMVDIYESGILDEIGGPPHLTVHDELDFSVPYGKEEYMDEINSMMENAVELKLPVLCDSEKGENWGAVK